MGNSVNRWWCRAYCTDRQTVCFAGWCLRVAGSSPGPSDSVDAVEDVPIEVWLAGELLPTYKDLGWEYDYHPVDHNFDPDATLCAVLVTIKGGTQSSPVHILLFHKGKHVGRARDEGDGFVTLQHDECTDDTVAVRFKVPGSTFKGPPRLVCDVKYQWIGDGRWVRIGPLPPPKMM
jgi:hypothetical protein